MPDPGPVPTVSVLSEPGRGRDELVDALSRSPLLRVRVAAGMRPGQPALVPAGPGRPGGVVVLRSGRPARDVRTQVAGGGTLPLLVVATVADTEEAVRTLRAGATSYLVEGGYGRDELLAAVLDTAAGRSHLSPAVLAAVVRRLRHPEPPVAAGSLSRRERQIMELVAEGHATAAIARREFIAEKTVRNHLNSIYAKLGVRSRAEAVRTWRTPDRATG